MEERRERRRSKPPFATDNQLENTDGVGAHHQRSLGVAACYLLFMLTAALLMTSLFQREATGTAIGTRATACLLTK